MELQNPDRLWQFLDVVEVTGHDHGRLIQVNVRVDEPRNGDRLWGRGAVKLGLTVVSTREAASQSCVPTEGLLTTTCPNITTFNFNPRGQIEVIWLGQRVAKEQLDRVVRTGRIDLTEFMGIVL